MAWCEGLAVERRQSTSRSRSSCCCPYFQRNCRNRRFNLECVERSCALAVNWSDRPADGFDSVTHRARLEKACQEQGIVTRKEERKENIGKAGRAMAATYFYPFYAHAPIETMNCSASVAGDRCAIWAPTQAPNKLQEEVAGLLG